MQIDKAGAIVVLTGAGISKESGLETFRDADGIWSKVRIEDVATPDAFVRDPARVQAFYNARRAGLLSPSVQPNAAHAALAKLQAEWSGDFLLVTQNIDDLHERAGSTQVLHMHGELLKVRCATCDDISERRGDVIVDEVCVVCGSSGQMRPDVVWFGEMPLQMERIEQALEVAALFVSIGTSGNVYPAAGFVQMVRHHGRGHTVELNLEPSEGATLFAETIYGPASDVVPSFIDRLLGA